MTITPWFGPSQDVRVWYVSDGKKIMLITYICEWSDRLHETGVCDEMVKNITFNA